MHNINNDMMVEFPMLNYVWYHKKLKWFIDNLIIENLLSDNRGGMCHFLSVWIWKKIQKCYDFGVLFSIFCQFLRKSWLDVDVKKSVSVCVCVWCSGLCWRLWNTKAQGDGLLATMAFAIPWPLGAAHVWCVWEWNSCYKQYILWLSVTRRH